jgi:hypothetical protein
MAGLFHETQYVRAQRSLFLLDAASHALFLPEAVKAHHPNGSYFQSPGSQPADMPEPHLA